MGVALKEPALLGEAPRRSPARPIFIAILIIALLGLLVFIYRATFVLYEERSALEYQSRGADYLAEGYFEDAGFELEVATRLGTPSARTYFLMGKTAAALGDIEKAVVNWRQAAIIDPDNRENRFALAAGLSALDKRVEALEALEGALDLKPDDIAARFLLARLLARENRLKEAASQYQALAGMGLSRRQLSEIHVALAKVYILQKRQPRAQHLLQSAWYMDKKNEEAWQLIMRLNRPRGHQEDVIGTIEGTDTVSSKITAPRQNVLLNEKVIEVSGQADAKNSAVAGVEVTYDGGHSWHRAKTVRGVYRQWLVRLKLPVSDGRRYTLYSRALTNNGTPERPREGVRIKVDNTGPPVFRQLEPGKPNMSGNWYATPPNITLSTLEADALMFYRWNGEDYRVYSGPLKAPVGRNRLYYFTRDQAGNVGPVEKLAVKVKLGDLE